MDSSDLNQTLLVAVALLASLTRLIHLLFASLRSCVREYYTFRIWLRVVERRARRLERRLECRCCPRHPCALSPRGPG